MRAKKWVEATLLQRRDQSWDVFFDELSVSEFKSIFKDNPTYDDDFLGAFLFNVHDVEEGKKKFEEWIREILSAHREQEKIDLTSLFRLSNNREQKRSPLRVAVQNKKEQEEKGFEQLFPRLQFSETQNELKAK
ncbi:MULTISPECIES: hypothetical protein [unclassified Brevibacillus]|uniref:hypothetical protein n=1 Tax=unclassified Brevibacillus TaxID=2684853 RepID=UPI00356AFD5F